MKNLLLLFMIAATFAACNNAEKKSNNNKAAETVECSKINVDSFLVVAENFIGKEISVCGTVDHVCKHGGKKVKLFSSCASHGIKGIATEKVGTFEADIEGSNICITGKVIENKIDMASIDEWESKVKANQDEHKHAEGEEGCSEHNPAMEQIAEHRKMVEESEKGYLPFYTIDVEEYHVCTPKEETCCQKKAKEEAKKACCDKVASEEKSESGCQKSKEGCSKSEKAKCAEKH